HTNENRNRGHNTNNCKFHINAYRRKKNNLVHITKVEDEHNHELVENIRIVSPYYRKLTPEMRDDIALLAICGMRADAIIEVLHDAGLMYLALMNQQQKNLTFHVDARFEGQDNHLVRFC
ncbi:14335_t:CDS:2, partial [Funneliformis caledonium]